MNRQILNIFTDSILVFLRRVEDFTLVTLLGAMITLAAVQILSRNLFDAGIVWGDVLVRILVLWLGLVGAMVATRNDKHIRIDIISRHLPNSLHRIADGIVKLFAAGVSAIVAYHSLQFVLAEMADGGLAFWKVPTWICVTVIPFAFTVITLRYVLMSAMCFMNRASSNPDKSEKLKMIES